MQRAAWAIDQPPLPSTTMPAVLLYSASFECVVDNPEANAAVVLT